MQQLISKTKCPKRTTHSKNTKKSGKRLRKKRYLELLRLEGQRGFRNLKVKYINSKNMNIIKEKYRKKERVNYVTVIFIRRKDQNKTDKKVIYNTVEDDSKRKKLMKVINSLHMAPSKFKDYVDTKKVAYSVLNYFTGRHY